LHSFPIPSFKKKHFLTDFKVTQVKSRKQDLLNETPIELVFTNVVKFDILMPVIVFGTAPQVFFGHP
jgi:hypothetical protein